MFKASKASQVRDQQKPAQYKGRGRLIHEIRFRKKERNAAAQRQGRISPLLFWKISGRLWNSERAADYYKTSPNTLIICFNTTKHVKAAEELKMILSSPQADVSSKAVKS